MGVGLYVKKIIDGDDFQLSVIFLQNGLQHLPPHAPETIDADTNHKHLPFSAEYEH
jgi:hypothetical protein